MRITSVPDDVHSARRPLDDADTLSTLERCYKLIQDSASRRISVKELPANSVPGSASSLRLSITSYLARFLKRSIFDKIKNRQTRLDHNLFDVIWPAMKKATKERRIDDDLNAGVVIPDFDVFVVFQEFLVPLIKDIHCLDLNKNLQPHPKLQFHPPFQFTQIDKEEEKIIDDNKKIIHLNLDTSGRWIKEGIVECSRNLEIYELSLNLNIGQLEMVERMITGKIISVNFANAIDEPEMGTYYTMNEILENSSAIRTILSASGLLIPLLDYTDAFQSAESVAINGQYWPYGRGVFVSHKADLAIWINVQDHFRLLCCTHTKTPGDIGEAYSKIGKAITYLEGQLNFRQSYFLGNLSTRPSFLGTGLKMTLKLELPHLVKERENLRYLCVARGLHMKADVFGPTVRISNMKSMSITEWIIFQEYCTAIANILQMEKDLSVSSSKNVAETLLKIFRKKKNSLVDANAD